jgi:hypothetical protein
MRFLENNIDDNFPQYENGRLLWTLGYSYLLLIIDDIFNMINLKFPELPPLAKSKTIGRPAALHQ